MSNLQVKEYKKFEDIKHIDEHGVEYWHARELMIVLEYGTWERFTNPINKAMLACQNSGFDTIDHFRNAAKMVDIGSGAKRKSQDYILSRYACYLIVQNGDPRKEVIALGQTYFAIQTRRQEVQDYFYQLDEDSKRLVIRGDVKQWNTMLKETAWNAGVSTEEEFAEFNNAGYMGLYGGLTVAEIHNRKKLTDKQKILDHMGSEELIANLFRISQTESKIKREKIEGKKNAGKAHNQVGQEVRAAIERIDGTMPENLPTPKKSIAEIQKEQMKKLKESRKNLMNDEE